MAKKLFSDHPLFPLWLLTIALIVYWIVPRMSEKGLFIDGLVYQNLSQNLAQGEAAFWAPRLENREFLFDQTDIFYDHPPLMFGIQSVLFSLFGRAAFPIYALLVMAGIVWGMALLWTLLIPISRKRTWLAFIPLFLLFTIPEWAQKITYNLLDPSLALWTTFAVYCIIRAFKTQTTSIQWSMLGGVCVLLAFLTKGPVGLFPVATPVLYFLFFRMNPMDPISFKTVFYILGSMLIVLLAGACVLYIYGPSRHFFENYLQRQVIASMQGEREEASTLLNHIFIFVKLAIQLSPLIVLSIAAWIVWRKRTSPFSFSVKSSIWFLLVTGLSASIPIVISAKHHSFYLIPSFIFFALGFGLWIYSLWPEIQLQKKSRLSRWWNGLLIGCIAGIVIYSFSRKERYYHSHRNVLQQIEALEPHLVPNETISAPENWVVRRGDLSGYLEYYFDIRLISSTNASKVIDIPNRKGHYRPEQILAETKDFILVQAIMPPSR